MKRKDYQKPTMKVVEVRIENHLLQASSSLGASRSGYGTANSDVADSEQEDGQWLWN